MAVQAAFRSFSVESENVEMPFLIKV